MTGAVPQRKPVLSKGVLIFLRIWLGVLTIITIVMVVLAIRELVDPSSDGQAGTVVITNCNTDHGGRRCYGDFTANSGCLVLRDAQVFGEDYGSVGTRHIAYGDASDRTIAVVSGGEEFTDVYIAVAFLVIWSAGFYFLVYRPIRQRRATRNAV